MYTTHLLTALLALTSLTTAALLPKPILPPLPLKRAPSTPSTAESILLAIAPQSSTCASPPVPAECATATAAAPYLIAAFQRHAIYHPAELAAVLALVAFESGDFRYATNRFPGRPGQGTRNMQMPAYNLAYARAVQPAALAALTTAPSVDGMSDTLLNDVRALVLPDEFSFASGAWFLVTYCGGVREALRTGGRDGFAGYMGCVGTEVTPERVAYWERARGAFGLDTK